MGLIWNLLHKAFPYFPLLLPTCTNPITGPWWVGVGLKDSSSASKHDEPHKRLLVFYSLSGRVCCGRSLGLPPPGSSPPLYQLRDGSRYWRSAVCRCAVRSLPTSHYPACTYHKILLRRVDGKAKPDEKTIGDSYKISALSVATDRRL